MYLKKGILCILFLLLCISILSADETLVSGGETRSTDPLNKLSADAYRPFIITDEMLNQVAKKAAKSHLSAIPPGDVSALSSNSLYSYLPWTDFTVRDQGYAGNCWIWASTAVVEIDHAKDTGIKDILSVEWPVRYYNNAGNYANCGGHMTNFNDYYTGSYGNPGSMKFIPWSNVNASYNEYFNTDCPPELTGDVGSSPFYSVSNMSFDVWDPYENNNNQTIDFIKSEINSGRAVAFIMGWPGSPSWRNFISYWSTNGGIYNPDHRMNDTYSNRLGHAMTIIGYDNTTRYWEVLNSWGINEAHPNGTFKLNMDMNYTWELKKNRYANFWTGQTNIDWNQTLTNHTIFASADSGGVITPAGNVTVPYGANQTFACSTRTGYQLQNLSIDGILYNPNISYTFTNVTRNHIIRVITTPSSSNLTANFLNTTTSGILPLNITFTDTSTGGPGWWLWSFGDASQNATTRNPAHIYNTSGSYLVTLTIGNTTTNQTSSIQRNLTIIGKNPVNASFTATPMSGIAPLAVNFTDSSTGDDIIGRMWNFGDGQMGMGPGITHTFTSTGTYTASLTVTSLWNNATTSRIIQVTGTPTPTYTINASADSGGSISPTGSVSVLQGANQTFLCSANTGFVMQNLYIDGVFNSPNATHSFTNVTRNHIIRVMTIPTSSNLTAGFTNSPTTGILPLNVVFTDTSAGGPTSWNWNFGDGTLNLTSRNPTHTYSTSGSYRVTLTIGNTTTNQTSSTQKNLIITGKSQINASFIANPMTGTAPLAVNFTDTSTGDDISGRVWNFGDGQTGTAPALMHIFTNGGTYPVSLRVTSLWQNATTQKSIQVSGPPPTNFTINSTASSGGTMTPVGIITIQTGDTRLFTITPSDGYEIYSVTVDGISQGPIVAYTFSNVTANHTIQAIFRIVPPLPGKRTIIASSDAGCTIQPSGIIDVPEGGQQIFSIWPAANYQLNNVNVDSVSQGPIRSYTFTNITTDHVISASSTAVGLIAGFTGSPTAGKPPLTVNFTDMSLGAPSNWFWRFGDGTFSTDQSPVHVYTRSGVYTVSLSIKNGSGSTIKTERDYVTLSDLNWIITAIAGAGGSISPSGNLTYPQGTTRTFTAIPSGGYKVRDLVVDGTSRGPQSSWTFTNIRENHSIDARFSPLGGDTPEITGVHPDQGQQGIIRKDVTITGNNIEDQATVIFSLGGQSNLTSGVVKTGQVLQVKELNLTTAPLGVYDVWVTNPGGLTGVLAKAFTVTGPESKAPVVTGVNPISADNGAIIPTFIITGQNFGGTDTVDFISGGISAFSLPAVIRGADLVIYNLSVARLYPGTFDIMVTNTTTGLKGTKYQTFSVVGNFSDSYVINATANEYAIIKPAGLITVKSGQSIEFTLQAKAGTSLSNLTVDSRQVPVPVNNRYSFSGVTANHTIHLKGSPASGVILAGFIANVTRGSIPLTVQFSDTSSGSPTQWSWNFGDGQLSTLQNPMHVYTRAGSFTVSLYARNSLSNNLKREKSFIHVNNTPTLVVNPVLSGSSSPVLPAGSMEIPGVVMPERRVLVPTFP